MSIQHILAPFQSSNESAWIGIDLAEELQQQGLTPALWSTETPHPVFVQYGINAIRPYQGKAPANGTLTVVGAEVTIGSWYESTQFETITLFNHQFSPSGFNRTMHRLTLQGIKTVKLQYTNWQLSKKTGLPGNIVRLPFNPQRLFNNERSRKKTTAEFTIGVVADDDLSHHHPDDILLYQKLAGTGMNVTIYGGTCLRPWLDGLANIHLHPKADNTQLGVILPKLDCLYFNKPLTLIEGPTQGMMAAIHMNLPIIAFSGGGYALTVKEYGQGVVFKNQQEAFDLIKKLI